MHHLLSQNPALPVLCVGIFDVLAHVFKPMSLLAV